MNGKQVGHILVCMCWCEHVVDLVMFRCYTFSCVCSLRGIHLHISTQRMSYLRVPGDLQLNSIHLLPLEDDGGGDGGNCLSVSPAGMCVCLLSDHLFKNV